MSSDSLCADKEPLRLVCGRQRAQRKRDPRRRLAAGQLRRVPKVESGCTAASLSATVGHGRDQVTWKSPRAAGLCDAPYDH